MLGLSVPYNSTTIIKFAPTAALAAKVSALAQQDQNSVILPSGIILFGVLKAIACHIYNQVDMLQTKEIQIVYRTTKTLKDMLVFSMQYTSQ